MLAAGRGLAAAHAAGVVHRDFKPHNVLRARDGRILVSDFGLAWSAEWQDTGMFIGTPAYMAPEQWARAATTPATDQFAFCVSLYEAIAGKRLFPGPTLDELRHQVHHVPAMLDLPRAIEPIVRRGLDPDPAHRWPSMTELLAALARVKRR